MTIGFICNKIYSKHQQQNNNKTLKEIFTKDIALKQTEIHLFSIYSARFRKILIDCPRIWICLDRKLHSQRKLLSLAAFKKPFQQ